MKIALDIDDTITLFPEYFSHLSKLHSTIIVTSRPNNKESIDSTIALLDVLDIKYEKVFFANWEDDSELNIPDCIEGPDRLLFQKVLTCENEEVSVMYDDDPGVIRLMKQYLPKIAMFKPQ